MRASGENLKRHHSWYVFLPTEDTRLAQVRVILTYSQITHSYLWWVQIRSSVTMRSDEVVQPVGRSSSSPLVWRRQLWSFRTKLQRVRLVIQNWWGRIDKVVWSDNDEGLVAKPWQPRSGGIACAIIGCGFYNDWMQGDWQRWLSLGTREASGESYGDDDDDVFN